MLMIDSSKECDEALELFKKENVPYTLYKIDDRDIGCCGGYQTKVPAVFAPEGIFRGLDGVREYLKIAKIPRESESAYW